MRRNAPFPRQPGLFSLFALRVVAASKPAFTRPWRGLFVVRLAQDIRAARNRGEEQGLSDEEIAFYDALAENESALQVMSDEKLRVIVHELLVSLRENVAVDWAHRESARARLRVLVKRILRKYGYPPDLQDAAVQMVLQQAEVLSASWQPGHSRA